MSPVIDQEDKQSSALPNFAESIRSSSVWPKDSPFTLKDDILPPTLLGWQGKLPHINIEMDPLKSTLL